MWVLHAIRARGAMKQQRTRYVPGKCSPRLPITVQVIYLTLPTFKRLVEPSSTLPLTTFPLPTTLSSQSLPLAVKSFVALTTTTGQHHPPWPTLTTFHRDDSGNLTYTNLLLLLDPLIRPSGPAYCHNLPQLTSTQGTLHDPS